MTGGRRLADTAYDPTFDGPENPAYYCGGYLYSLDIRPYTATDVNDSYYTPMYHYCGIILAYNLSCSHSWDGAVRLSNLINHSYPTHDRQEGHDSPLPVMILGLKADIQFGHWSLREEREEFARQQGSLFAECSALTGEGINEAIGTFVGHAHATIMRHPDSYTEGMGPNAKTQLFYALSQAVRAVQTKSSPLPDVYRKRRWLCLAQEKELPSEELDYRGGAMCIALWNRWGCDESLMNVLLHDEKRSIAIDGQWCPKTTAIWEDALAGFVCDGYHYTLNFISSEPPNLSDYYGVVLAYDVHSQESWHEVCKFLRRLRWARRGEGGIPVQFMLLGIDTHVHLGDWSGALKHRVSRTEAQAFAQQNDCHFAECYTRGGEGIHQAFGLFVQHAHALRMRFDGDPEALEFNKNLAYKVFRRVLGSAYMDKKARTISPFAGNSKSTSRYFEMY